MKLMQYNPISFLKETSPPWILYNLYKNILPRSVTEEILLKLKNAMLKSELIQESLKKGKIWEKSVLKRHNDATHPIHHMEILVEFGLTQDDPDILGICHSILAHQTEEGAFQTQLVIPKRFKGTGEASWDWMACDIPILIYFLSKMGFQDDVRVQKSCRSFNCVNSG
ncbi:MAG: hypothetical protein ACFFDT_40990 [Candidatus Hodarchaeota archaeon]